MVASPRLRTAAVGEVVARRRSPAVKGSAADALSAIAAQIEASNPGSTRLGIAEHCVKLAYEQVLRRRRPGCRPPWPEGSRPISGDENTGGLPYRFAHYGRLQQPNRLRHLAAQVSFNNVTATSPLWSHETR